jgi:hypothetical protein
MPKPKPQTLQRQAVKDHTNEIKLGLEDETTDRNDLGFYASIFTPQERAYLTSRKFDGAWDEILLIRVMLLRCGAMKIPEDAAFSDRTAYFRAFGQLTLGLSRLMAIQMVVGSAGEDPILAALSDAFDEALEERAREDDPPSNPSLKLKSALKPGINQNAVPVKFMHPHPDADLDTFSDDDIFDETTDL